MKLINNKEKYIFFSIVLIFLAGCNGYSKQSYYKIFINDKISKSLEVEYNEKYSEKWMDYGYGKKYSLEELFAREDYVNIKDYTKQQTYTWNLDSKDRASKEYCVYSLSYFIPLNFWNLRFSDEQYVRKAIKDLNQDSHIDGMKYIKIDSFGVGTPIYSNFCIRISGVVLREEK